MNDRRGEPPASSSKPQLTAGQLLDIRRARELAAADPARLADGYPAIDPENMGMVYGFAFGVARVSIDALLAIINDLTGGEE